MVINAPHVAIQHFSSKPQQIAFQMQIQLEQMLDPNCILKLTPRAQPWKRCKPLASSVVAQASDAPGSRMQLAKLWAGDAKAIEGNTWTKSASNAISARAALRKVET